MGRIMNEEEFKESLKNVRQAEEPDKEEKPEPAPRKKPGPKPGNKKKKATQRKAPVTTKQKAEALPAAMEFTKAFADFLTQRADILQQAAEKYIEYTDILEGMK